MSRMIDADALIKELRADIDVYRGRGDRLYVDGVLHGLNIAIGEAQKAAEDSEKRDQNMKLTGKELTICRATGAKWVTRDDDPAGLVCLYITEERPPQDTSGAYAGIGKLGIMDARAFPSLERGACIRVNVEDQATEEAE